MRSPFLAKGRALWALLFFAFCLPLFQNCSNFSSVASILQEQSKLSSGGNGNSYDGKPSGYTRLAPGSVCANQEVSYGSLEIFKDHAIVISNENYCSGQSEKISLKDLEFSSFSDVYVGYGGGVYTYLKDRNENIKNEIFTEAWCKALKPGSQESLVEFAVEWQAAGRNARFAVFNQKDLPLQFVSVERKIDIDHVSYKTASNDLLSINFRQRISGSTKISGKYLGEIDQKMTEISVECLMGGQFDPIAPEFDFSGTSDQTLAVGETMTPLVPAVNKATAHFKISDPLPRGISLDAKTGVISGSPLELSPQREFWVTAQFAFGEITRRLSIGVGQVQFVDKTSVNSQAPACTDPNRDCDLGGAIARARAISPTPLIVRLLIPAIDFQGQELVISDYVSIVGWTSKTVLDAHSLSRHFSVLSSTSQSTNSSTFAHLELSNLRLINGRASMGGSIYAKYGSLSIKQSSFGGNIASYGGGSFVAGGALALMMSSLTIFDSEFINNQAPDSNFGSGGAIDMIWPLSASIGNTVFKGNSTYNFGGAVNINHKTFWPIEITNCIFDSNSADRQGEAVSSNEVDLFISRSRFVANKAAEAAAVSSAWAKRTWIVDSESSGNISTSSSVSSILRFYGATWDSGPEVGTSMAYIINSQFLGNETQKPAGAVLTGTNMKIILGHSNFDSSGKSKECNSDDKATQSLQYIHFEPTEFISLGENTSSDGSCPR